MEGVRVFVVEHESFESSFYPWKPHMSGDLVWLRLCRFSCSRFLFSMSLRSLRVLEIHGSGHLDVSTSWPDQPSRYAESGLGKMRIVR